MHHLTEHQHAELLAHWLRANNYRFHHSPNETFTKSWRQKRKNTLEGVSAGFPDYCVILKRGNCLFLELKKSRGKNGGLNGSKITDAQKAWIDDLGNCPNVFAFVAHGFEEAKTLITQLESW